MLKFQIPPFFLQPFHITTTYEQYVSTNMSKLYSADNIISAFLQIH